MSLFIPKKEVIEMSNVINNRIVFAAVSAASFIALVVLSNPTIISAVSVAVGGSAGPGPNTG